MNKSRLEMYVENYLRSHKMAPGEQNYLRKAKAYIDYALFYDECDFTEPVLDLYTLRDNQFTHTVYNMLLNIGVNLYRKSLERTSAILEKAITGPCCTILSKMVFSYKIPELQPFCPLIAVLIKDGSQIGDGCYINPPIDDSLVEVINCLNLTYSNLASFTYNSGTQNITVTIFNPDGSYGLSVINLCS